MATGFYGHIYETFDEHMDVTLVNQRKQPTSLKSAPKSTRSTLKTSSVLPNAEEQSVTALDYGKRVSFPG